MRGVVNWARHSFLLNIIYFLKEIKCRLRISGAKKIHILVGCFHAIFKKNVSPRCIEKTEKLWDMKYARTSCREVAKRNKSDFVVQYHYSSIELLIFRHFCNCAGFSISGPALDIGSGSGHWIDFYDRQGADAICGIEISKNQCAYLTEKYSGRKNIAIYHGDVCSVLESIDKKFSIVSAISVMCYLVDDGVWERAIMRISSKMANGGLLIVGGYFGGLGDAVFFDKGGDIGKKLRSYRKWVKALTRHGFRNIKLYKNNSFYYIGDTPANHNILIATYGGGGTASG